MFKPKIQAKIILVISFSNEITSNFSQKNNNSRFY